MKRILLLAILVLSLPALAQSEEDRKLAAMLASSGTKLAADGKAEKARGLWCRALANDENCPEALYELGKMLEKEGEQGASDFLERAANEFHRLEAVNPSFAGKRADAERRFKALNPRGSKLKDRLRDMLAEYATDLERIKRRSQGSAEALAKDALEAIRERTETLRLPIKNEPKIVLPADNSPIGKWNVKSGDYTGVWEFFPNGTVKSTRGSPNGRWTPKDDCIKIIWQPNIWDTFNFPLDIEPVYGDSWTLNKVEARRK